MNEFTKKELEQLYAVCILHDPELISPLRSKLFSMVTNYCEHRPYILIGGSEGTRIKCSACERELM
jgi:hypothetical protein